MLLFDCIVMHFVTFNLEFQFRSQPIPDLERDGERDQASVNGGESPPIDKEDVDASLSHTFAISSSWFRFISSITTSFSRSSAMLLQPHRQREGVPLKRPVVHAPLSLSPPYRSIISLISWSFASFQCSRRSSAFFRASSEALFWIASCRVCWVAWEMRTRCLSEPPTAKWKHRPYINAGYNG